MEICAAFGYVTWVVVDDAACLRTLDDSAFDGVVCNLSLMDIPDLAGACAAVYRVLRPGGWFVSSVMHPCFESPHASWLERDDGSVSRVMAHTIEPSRHTSTR